MILVAIGANLPARNGTPALQTCRAAAGSLALLPGLRLVATSRWYCTAPVPASDQPDYINGVAALDGVIAPAVLLDLLHVIEAAHGRDRGAPNAARTLDLDIIDLNGAVRDTPDPILPHPSAHLRGFVLHPLRDVAPRWVHPRLGLGIDGLIASCRRLQRHPACSGACYKTIGAACGF